MIAAEIAIIDVWIFHGAAAAGVVCAYLTHATDRAWRIVTKFAGDRVGVVFVHVSLVFLMAALIGVGAVVTHRAFIALPSALAEADPSTELLKVSVTAGVMVIASPLIAPCLQWLRWRWIPVLGLVSAAAVIVQAAMVTADVSSGGLLSDPWVAKLKVAADRHSPVPVAFGSREGSSSESHWFAKSEAGFWAAKISLHPRLKEILSESELYAVALHELGHVVNRDDITKIADVFVLGVAIAAATTLGVVALSRSRANALRPWFHAYYLPALIVFFLVADELCMLAYNARRQNVELAADRFAVCFDPPAKPHLASALMKLSVDPRVPESQSTLVSLKRSHPPAARRLAAIEATQCPE